MRIPNPIEIGYFAGLFDGEGTITLAKRAARTRQRRDSYQLSIGVVLTYLPAIQKIKEIWQVGGIYGPYQQRPNQKLQWHWQAKANQAKEILKLCLPYLFIKKYEAELAIAFQQEKASQRDIWRHNKYIPDSYFRREAGLAEILKNLRLNSHSSTFANLDISPEM